jgi:hypothetical protein
MRVRPEVNVGEFRARGGVPEESPEANLRPPPVIRCRYAAVVMPLLFYPSKWRQGRVHWNVFVCPVSAQVIVML